jgi:hypothetical protein
MGQDAGIGQSELGDEGWGMEAYEGKLQKKPFWGARKEFGTEQRKKTKLSC